MKTLVTGAKGMLGTDLCRVFENECDILAVDIEEMDICQRNTVFETIFDFRPDIVFHLAAMTNVDECEKQPEKAFHVNTVGTQNVVMACQKLDIPLVYVSTISVFDGTKPEPYTEYDLPNPKSVYSLSKYQGEEIVKSLLNKYYIVRAGWMFGGGKEDKKFVAKIIELAQIRPFLKGVNDKFGSPVYTKDFAQAMKHIIASEQYGIYHAVNEGGPVSRYEIARKILEFSEINDCEVLPVSSAEFPLSAPRPRMEAGYNLAMKLNNMPHMRHWEDALEEYIQTVLIGEQND